MADDDLLGTTTLAVARRRALLPRRVLLAAGILLSLVGIKGIVDGPAAATVAAPRAESPAAAPSPAGFAEAFTRAYLTWDAERPDAHGGSLAPFVGPDLDVDAGLPVPVRGSARVTWTATVAQAATDQDRTVVTVAAALAGDARLRYLAVPVSSRDGRLAVADYPALVGHPPAAMSLARAGNDVEDPALASIVRRALANYLAGELDNLRADVVPGARLEPPADHLQLDDVVSLQWAGRARGRVGVVVVARDPSGDVAYTLRYELRVAKRDRWYVAEINPPMARKELP